MGQSSSSESPRPGQRPADHPPIPPSSAASQQACPVDHKSREVWLRAAQEQQQGQNQPTPSQPPQPGRKLAPFTTSATAPTQPFPQPKLTNSRLSTDRQISTIPRALSTSSPSPSSTTSAPPAQGKASHGSPAYSNAETPDSSSTDSPYWVYPSESQFYSAVLRKQQHKPPASSIPAVIPIHNAVNERTWAEILRWERFAGAGAPPVEEDGAAQAERRLVSFAGDSAKLTPRARVRGWLGYRRPFDRHDWVVERGAGGERVEYVIDFYEGRAAPGGGPGPLNFYLDVRPKLNSWEGVRMRLGRWAWRWFGGAEAS